MRARIAMSFGLAALVIASVFGLIQSSSTPNAGATSVNETQSTVSTNAVAQIGATAGRPQLEQFGSGNDANSISQEPTVGLQPGTEPIYVYPDGSLAPPPGTYSNESHEYYEADDDHDEYEDHDEHEEHDSYESDHDDEDGLWNRLTSLRFGVDADHEDDEDHDDYDDEDHGKEYRDDD